MKKISLIFGLLAIAILFATFFTLRTEKTRVIPTLKANSQYQLRTETPEGIKVPGQNEKLSEAEAKLIAVPTIVKPAAPGSGLQFRSFDIKAVDGAYLPSSIIANIGDIIHINFTAVDKDYDLSFPSYSIKQTVKAGETKSLEFQAVQDGNYTYYCELCGGLDGPTKGSIIIKK